MLFTTEIRLRGATVENAGRVEVYHNTGKNEGAWGTICGDYDWDIEDANVVCRSLHYSGAEMALRVGAHIVQECLELHE